MCLHLKHWLTGFLNSIIWSLLCGFQVKNPDLGCGVQLGISSSTRSSFVQEEPTFASK
jgi:hypothetical protein